MEPVLAVEPVIISPRLTPSKSPCQVLSDVTRVMSFAFSNSVGSAGVILMSKEPLAWTMCISFWAATLRARLIAAAATANLTLISPPKCNLQPLNPSSFVSLAAARPAASTYSAQPNDSGPDCAGGNHSDEAGDLIREKAPPMAMISLRSSLSAEKDSARSQLL